MANVGLRVKGASSVVQIDSFYRNFELIATGNLTLTGGGDVGHFGDISIPSGESFPVLALSTPTYYCWGTMLNDTTYRIYAIGPSGVIPTIRYYIYGTPKPSNVGQTGAIGLRIRNRVTGNIAFSSERKYMKVLQVRSGQMAVQDTLTGSVAAGRSIAIAVQLRPYSWRRRTVDQGQPVVQITIFGGQIRCSGNSWSYNFGGSGGEAFLGNLPTISYDRLGYNFMILDVTGF